MGEADWWIKSEDRCVGEAESANTGGLSLWTDFWKKLIGGLSLGRDVRENVIGALSLERHMWEELNQQILDD